MRLWPALLVLAATAVLAIVTDVAVYDTLAAGRGDVALLAPNGLALMAAVHLVTGFPVDWSVGQGPTNMFFIAVPAEGAIAVQVESSVPCSADGDFNVYDQAAYLGRSACKDGASTFTHLFPILADASQRGIYMRPVRSEALSGWILKLDVADLALDSGPVAWKACVGGCSNLFKLDVPSGRSVQVAVTSEVPCTSPASLAPFIAYDDFAALPVPACEAAGRPFVTTSVFAAVHSASTQLLKVNNALGATDATGHISAVSWRSLGTYGSILDWTAPGGGASAPLDVIVESGSRAVVQVRTLGACAAPAEFVLRDAQLSVPSLCSAYTFGSLTYVLDVAGTHAVSISNGLGEDLGGTLEISRALAIAAGQRGVTWAADRVQHSDVYIFDAGERPMRAYIRATSAGPCTEGGEARFRLADDFTTLGTSSCARGGAMSIFGSALTLFGTRYLKIHNGQPAESVGGTIAIYAVRDLLPDEPDVIVSAAAGHASQLFIAARPSALPVTIQVIIPGRCVPATPTFTALVDFLPVGPSYCDASGTFSLFVHVLARFAVRETSFAIQSGDAATAPLAGQIAAFTLPTVRLQASWQGLSVRPFTYSAPHQLTVGAGQRLALEVLGSAPCSPSVAAFVVYEASTAIGTSSCRDGSAYLKSTFSVAGMHTVRIYNPSSTVLAGRIRAGPASVALALDGGTEPVAVAAKGTSHAYTLTVPPGRSAVLTVTTADCRPGAPAFGVLNFGTLLGSSTCTRRGGLATFSYAVTAGRSGVNLQLVVRNNSAAARLAGTIRAATAIQPGSEGVETASLSIGAGARSGPTLVMVSKDQSHVFTMASGTDCVEGVPSFSVYDGEVFLGYSYCKEVNLAEKSLSQAIASILRLLTSGLVTKSNVVHLNYFEMVLAQPGMYAMDVQNLTELSFDGVMIISVNSAASPSTTSATNVASGTSATSTTSVADLSSVLSMMNGMSSTSATRMTNSTRTTSAPRTILTTNTTSTTGTTGTPSTGALTTTLLPLSIPPVWTIFQYGATGSTVPDVFAFAQTAPVMLEVQDFVCSGNRFAIYDNGVFIGNSTYALNDGCATFAPTVESAAGNLYYTSFERLMPPGAHRITLQVIASVAGHGAAGIRIKYPLSVCALQLSSLFLVKTAEPFAAAEATCQSIGLSLANITTYNFADATRLVYECVGAFSRAFLKSFQGDTYGNSCLALHTSGSVPGGSIGIPPSCAEPLPLLCQA